MATPTSHQNSNVCINCQQRFTSVVYRRKHEATCNGMRARQRPCRICGAPPAGNEALLFEHFRIWHRGERPFACDYCAHQFAYNSQCRRHMRTCTGRAPRPSGTMYTCRVCAAVFKGAPSIMRHFKYAHPSEKPFSCEHCHENYSNTCTLVRHERGCNGDPVRRTDRRDNTPHMVVCRLCAEVFTGHPTLRTHFELFHAHTLPYECARACGAVFTTHGYAVIHEQKCDGISRQWCIQPKQAACRVCAQQFDSNTSMRAHVLNEHGSNQPYACVRGCGTLFREAGTQRKHERKCTGRTAAADRVERMKCRICFCPYPDEKSAIAHFDEHHPSAKPFACDSCGAQFKLSTSRYHHLRKCRAYRAANTGSSSNHSHDGSISESSF